MCQLMHIFQTLLGNIEQANTRIEEMEKFLDKLSGPTYYLSIFSCSIVFGSAFALEKTWF